MKLIISTILLVTYVVATPVEQSMVFNQDGSYKFSYDTGEQQGRHGREEVRNADGSVEGRYSYEDPEGNTRVVNYRAGKHGFVASGDVGVPGAPQSQVPLVVPTSNEAPTDIIPPADENPEKLAPTEATVTSKPSTTAEPDQTEGAVKDPEDLGRKRETGSPLFYSGELLNNLPLSTPFGRRRLDIPTKVDDINKENEDTGAHLNTDSGSQDAPEPIEQSAIKGGQDKPLKPSKPGSVEPLSFIYSVGSPYVPSLLHVAPQQAETPVQAPVTDGKGAAKYYIYVPSHHYFGTPSYFYLPQAEIKPEEQMKPVTDEKDTVGQEVKPPASIPHRAAVAQPVVPVVAHAEVPSVHFQPQLNAIRYLSTQGFPFTYHSEIKHAKPTVGVPQESAVGLTVPSTWSYSSASSLPAPGTQQVPVAQGVPGQERHPQTVLTYIQPESANYVPGSKPTVYLQPDSAKYVPASKPTVYLQPDSVRYVPASRPTVYLQPDSVKYVPASQPGSPSQTAPAGPAQQLELHKHQDNSVPASSAVESVDQLTLRRPVYHHYVFKGPNASYGYHYQY